MSPYLKRKPAKRPFAPRRAIAGLFLAAGFQAASLAADPAIAQMLATYAENQARFHVQYKGKSLNGNAVVRAIEAGLLGGGRRFNVQLDVNRSTVQCWTADREAAASLNRGEAVSFQGVVDDVVLGTLIVNDCSFKRALTQAVNTRLTATARDDDEALAARLAKAIGIPAPAARALVAKSDSDSKRGLRDSLANPKAGWNMVPTLSETLDLNGDGRADYVLKNGGYCGTVVPSCGYPALVSRGGAYELAHVFSDSPQFNKSKSPPLVEDGLHILQWRGSAFAVVAKKQDPIQVDCQRRVATWDGNRFQFRGKLPASERARQTNATDHALWSETNREFVDGCRMCGYDRIIGRFLEECPGLFK